MSALISGIAGNVGGIFNWLGQVTGIGSQNQASQVSSTSNVSSTSSSGPSVNSSMTGNGTTSNIQGKHHHHHASNLSSGMQSAITSALQNAPSGSNANSIIQNTITSFLSGASAAGGASTNSMSSTLATLENSATGSTGSAGSNSGTTGSSLTEQFFQLLHNNGVTPQDFHQDLMSGIEQAQQNGGQPNVSSLFNNTGPGTLIDELG
jgi:hypothetical protein